MAIECYDVREHHATQNDESIYYVIKRSGIEITTEPLAWSTELESQLRDYLLEKKIGVTKVLNRPGLENPPLAQQYFGTDLDPDNSYVVDELNLVKDLLTMPSNTLVRLSNQPDRRCSLCRFKKPETQVAPHCLLEQTSADEAKDIKRYAIPILRKLGIDFKIVGDTDEFFEIQLSMGDYRKFLINYDALIEI